ncbi:MAG: hypothetical protein ACOX1P_22230 [Thermoguttaceae bacterium]|jgi:hypothetical protein
MMKTLGPLSIMLWFAATAFSGLPAASAARPAAELALPEGVDDLVFAVRPTGPDIHGFLTIIDPRLGPDHQASARRIHAGGNWRDPYPLSATRFLAARDRDLFLLDDQGRAAKLFSLGDPRPEMRLHEPAPIRPRHRERLTAARIDNAQPTGRFVLADVTRGRNMEGVARGEIKKLLVLEQLPAPFHNSPGFDGISLWGPFTIARMLGTVPVEEDGSACFETPAWERWRTTRRL